MKIKILVLTSLLIMSSCANVPTVTHESERSPAGWYDSCVSSIAKFFKIKQPESAVAANLGVIPELSQLNPVEKVFANGKKYIEYTANINVMNKYPDYEQFLEETAEIVFMPIEPFGHVALRLGKKIYSFNNLKYTSIKEFKPYMKKSANPDMISTTGFVFQVGKNKMASLKKELELFYNSSQSHNIPPFDAFSADLKIVGTGKNLSFLSPSPKYANNLPIKGVLVEKDGKMVLDAGNGQTVPVTKKGNDYYTPGFSCSSSAGWVMENFFGITLSGKGGAQAMAAALTKGNTKNSISPLAIIKYYEE